MINKQCNEQQTSIVQFWHCDLFALLLFSNITTIQHFSTLSTVNWSTPGPFNYYATLHQESTHITNWHPKQTEQWCAASFIGFQHEQTHQRYADWSVRWRGIVICSIIGQTEYRSRARSASRANDANGRRQTCTNRLTLAGPPDPYIAA